MAESAETLSTTNELDLSGRQLGDYQLLRRLGRGAMADVYLAEQLSLRRQVALKVLKPHLAVDEVYVKRFHNEAQAAAKLTHANIVQIHEVGCVEGIHYIAQEYVAGQNLRELLARRGPPEVRQAVAILRQVAAALRRAAEEGIVHRDIKPENIMIAKTGEVKVADFGLARVTSDPQGLNLTQVGITMGTPLYMSPEQVEGRSLDPRSDIYALGVTTYHMLAGQPPFRGETALSVAVQHLNVQPERLETLRPDLPTGLCRIVHRMLAKSPAERYPTARDLLRDLRGLPIADDQPWDDATDDEATAWSAAELLALGEGRSEATQQLDAIMKTQLSTTASKRRPLALLGGILAAFVVGALAAFLTRERFVLTPKSAANSVVRRSDGKRQLDTARHLDTEEGYKSVNEFFPADKACGLLAKRQLALWYLRNERYNSALKLFDEFAKKDEVDLQSRAFGLAGQAVVLSAQKRYVDSSEKVDRLRDLADGGKPPQPISKLLTIKEENNDQSLSQFLLAAIRANDVELDKRGSRREQAWITDHFPSDAPAPRSSP